MDRITKSLLKDFVKTMEIQDNDQSKNFEAFSAFSVISNLYNEKFELNDVLGGNGNDTGIDGLAIILSGIMVTTIEEVQDIIEKSGSISEVTFVLIQAKTSASFNGGDIGTFGSGAADFFSEEPQLIRNDFISRKSELVNYIIDNASTKIKKMTCELFYVTTGKWIDDANIIARINFIKNNLSNLNLFKEINFTCLGAIELHKYYQQTQEKVNAKFKFPKKLLIPDIEGVKEAYIGTIELSEFIKLLEDDYGNIKRSVFYDNVRDFQGENEVNHSITKTLKSERSDRLILLNNGITVVARSGSISRDEFTIEDYQIVNGCQTSHVIFNNKELINDSMFLSIKIIISDNDDVKSNITIANNSQTVVRKEDLLALTDFQKKLELFYASFEEKSNKLYYERRARQYDAISSIEKVRVVSISSQIKSFASMFLDKPHLASRFYGKLLEQNSNAFSENHELMPYYTSSFALYRLEYFFRNKTIDNRFRKYRYHLLMMLRYYLSNEKLPHFNSKSINKYCETINSSLYKSDFIELIRFLCSALEEVVVDLNDTEITKRQTLVDELLIKVKTLKI